MLPRKRTLHPVYGDVPYTAPRPMTPLTIEHLWEMFEARRDVPTCLCGCSFDFRMHMYPESADDELVAEHLDFYRLDPEPVTRLENWWRHFIRWGHDGRNPLGGKAVALPTWQARQA